LAIQSLVSATATPLDGDFEGRVYTIVATLKEIDSPGSLSGPLGSLVQTLMKSLKGTRVKISVPNQKSFYDPVRGKVINLGVDEWEVQGVMSQIGTEELSTHQDLLSSDRKLLIPATGLGYKSVVALVLALRETGERRFPLEPPGRPPL
jgi:hypothetical protein